MARIEELPESFLSYTRETMGEELFAAFVSGLGEEAPVSIRVNRAKWDGGVAHGERVPWSVDGYYLPDRPNFTFEGVKSHKYGSNSFRVAVHAQRVFFAG